MITLVCLGLNLILHLAHHIARFKRYCCKRFAAKRTFQLKADNAASAKNWGSAFVCGVVLEGHWRM